MTNFGRTRVLIPAGLAALATVGLSACSDSTSGMDGPSSTVHRFFERFERFDTAGMSELICAEDRDDFESSMFLMQGLMGFGSAFGIGSVNFTWEDPSVTTIYSDGQTASVRVGGRINMGSPYGSTPLNKEVPLRNENGSWCIPGDPTESL